MAVRLCSIPSLVVIFSGLFLGIISAEYTIFLGIKLVHWLASWPEMHNIQVEVSGLPKCVRSAFGNQSKSDHRELERS